LRIYSAAGTDENRLNDTVTTTVNVSPSGTVISQNTYCRNGLNKPILDNSTTYDTITLSIPNAFNVRDLNIRIDTVIHTYDGDLGFSLTHSSINVTNFINHVGGTGENFIRTVLNDSATIPIANGTAPFTGTFQPSTPLTPFNNNPVNGTWVLAINDNASIDQGFLRAWCIQVTYETLTGGIQTIEVPNYFYLNQNYPNPFNPVSTIRFGIPKSGNVTLKVYDLLGREVRTLVNEKKEPGTYEVEMDGTNLASGIYLYKIEAGNFTAVKKMMLIK
jgi:subtilisin-like proprotein convertase family protein